MDSADLAGSVLEGRYQVRDAVSRGAMGVVYRAERIGLGKIVAIKVMHDELPDEISARARFEIEAMAMAKLEHPHCAAVLDVGIHEGRPFVVMDFVSGTDVKHLVEEGPVPIARAITIARQTLAGLAHAHELGIVHRDIKPANVMISQKAGVGDHVKVLDFGLARLQQEAKTTPKLTVGIVVGTPAYMAPEQIRGQAIDHRVDLYSTGVMLLELLTGKKPFVSATDDPMEVVSRHLRETPPRLDALLPGTKFGPLEDVVRKSLAKAAKDRYQTADEFVRALDEAAKQIERGDLREESEKAGGVPVAVSGAASGATSAGSSVAGAVPAGVTQSPGRLRAARESYQPPLVGPPLVGPPNVATRSGWNVPKGDAASSEISPSMVIPQGGTRLGVPAHRATPPAGSNIVDPTQTPPPVENGYSNVITGAGDAPSVPGGTSGANVGAVPGGTRAGADVGVGVVDPSIGTAPTAYTPVVGSPIVIEGALASGQVPQLATPPGGVPIAQQNIATAPVVRPSRFSRGHLAIAAGIAAVLVIGIIAATSGGTTETPVVAKPIEPVPREPEIEMASRDGVAEQRLLDKANASLQARNFDAALDTLSKGRAVFPDNPQMALAAGKAYFGKLYWSQGLSALRDALRLDPELRTDPELIKTVLAGFITTPSYHREIAAFLREDIGTPAEAYLAETAEDHPSASIRKRASDELKRYQP